MMKKALKNWRKPLVDGLCDEACLQLGEDPIPRLTVVNFLQRVGSNPITYNNNLTMSKQVFLS